MTDDQKNPCVLNVIVFLNTFWCWDGAIHEGWEVLGFVERRTVQK
jgi:hypothetical protein